MKRSKFRIRTSKFSVSYPYVVERATYSGWFKIKEWITIKVFADYNDAILYINECMKMNLVTPNTVLYEI